MRLQFQLFLLGTAIVPLQPCLASASDDTRHFTVSAFGSYQAYDMSDVNSAMQYALASYSGAQADKNEISGGPGFGGALRVWPSDRAFVSLEFQRLLASNSGSGQYFGSTYTVDLEVPAASIGLGAGYVLMPGSAFRFGLTGGAGYYLSTGDLVTRGPGVNDKSRLEGGGFGVHGSGLLLVKLAGKLDVEVDAGYRYAKTTDVTSNGYRIQNSDGSPAKIDWSGFTARAGLTFWVSDR